MDDLISRQAAINAVNQYNFDFPQYMERFVTELRDAMKADLKHDIEALPPAQPEPKWIPFKARPLTEEEKEDHPELDCILDCKLPDDGQRILVSVSVRGHERVQYDEFYADDGCYLYSGYEIGTEAVAWMPLPEPYAERRTDEAD